MDGRLANGLPKPLIPDVMVEGRHAAPPRCPIIGVATWQPGDTRKSLLARADAAMYRAKHGGRNRVEY